MRQGEVASKGQWQGSAAGGVTAPDPILLPDPARRFAATAARLDALATGHPMAGWLAFMAALARAQHRAATAALDWPMPDAVSVERSVAARMPPLAADGHDRPAVWRDVLGLILDTLAGEPCPPQTRSAIDDLRAASPEAIEKLAGDFLSGRIEAGQAGQAMFVAAALQVYFTRLASGLVASDLRLLPERGLCPCCGSAPSVGLITATGKTPGTRYLHCSLCSTAWNHVRAVCITCGGSRGLELQTIEGGTGAIAAETCPSCSTYAKMLYRARDTGLDPTADDLASLALDLMMADEGWPRHAPHPLVLIG